MSDSFSYWSSLFSTPAPTIQLPPDFATDKLEYVPDTCQAEFEQKAGLVDAIYDHWKENNVVNRLEELEVGNFRLAFYLTAFLVIVHRRTQLSDLVVATQVKAGGEISPALLRINLEEGVTFKDLLKMVCDSLVNTVGNVGKAGFDAILKKLLDNSAAQGHSKTEVDITAFSYFEFMLQNSVSELDQSKAQLHMSISLEIKDESFNMTSRYNSSYFWKDTVIELLVQINKLASVACTNMGLPILHYDLSTKTAERVLPNPKSDSHLDPTWPGPITTCFDQMAIKFPHRLAIESSTECVSYRSLRLMSDQLAKRLNRAGVGLGSVVGIFASRCVSLPWTIMGILKSGAAYTMMDPKYPTDRIIACMDIAKPRAWISMGDAGVMPDELKIYLDGCNLSFFCTMSLITGEYDFIDRSISDSSLIEIENFLPEITQDTVAVITFTSGTSGLPKGVMGRHGPLTHFYPWMAETFGISEQDRFSMCSGIAHDPLQRDIFTALFFGALCCVPTDSDIMEPGALARWFCAKKITISCLTPAMLQLLTSIDNVASVGSPSIVPSAGPITPITSPLKSSKSTDFGSSFFTGDLTFSLRNAFFVGDCLVKRDVARLARLAPNSQCINLYGSTETQRAVAYFPVPSLQRNEKEFDSLKSVIPVGTGMKDVDLILINSAGLQAGIGELAEIYMRSPHLAKGYIGLESASKEKFVDNPFIQPPKSWDRMYRTGDLGRYNVDGTVECIGRADDQVKIRGFRIELGEINSTLSKHDLVKDNVTIVRADNGPDSKCLVSYAVINREQCEAKHADDEDYLEATLKSYLRNHLPVYMIPSAIVILEKLPLTANGKINRSILPAPANNRTSSKVPRNLGSNFNILVHLTPTQSKVAEAWSKLLNRPAPSQNNDLEANFFDCGGHSLGATKLTLNLREKFNLPNLPVSALLKNPTILGLSRAVEELLASRSGSNDHLEHQQKLAASVNMDRFDQYLKQEAERYFQSLPSVEEVSGLLDQFDLSKVQPKTILLTGATGFLGAFLLSELLVRSTEETKIVCLVREDNAENAKKRLLRTLKNHGLLSAEFESKYSCRIEAIAGDMSLGRLGLSEESFDNLAKRVDIILHNGALLHWLMSYEKLRDSNAGSTCELLKLATMHHIKPFHHVSTTSVFDTTRHRSQKVVLEKDNLATTVGLHGGYPQSKWVAEKLLLIARDRLRLPIAIYRPGYITGSSKSGIWNTDDFLCRLIKGCIQLEAAPIVMSPLPHLPVSAIDMSPVDYCASTIASLAMNSVETVGHCFHVTNPSPMPYCDLFSGLVKCGYNVPQIPYQEWRQLLESAVLKNENNALAAMLATFSDGWSDNLQNPTYDQASIQLMASRGIQLESFPLLDPLVGLYVSYLNQCKFLEPPPNPAFSGFILNLESSEDVVQLTRTART